MISRRQLARDKAQRVADETGKPQWVLFDNGGWFVSAHPGEWRHFGPDFEKIEPQRKEWTE